MNVVIDIEEVYLKGINEIQNILQRENQVTIQIPLESINSTNSYINIIIDYIEASYISESIAKYSKRIDIDINHKLFHYPVVHIIIQSVDSLNLAEEIYELSLGFSGEDDESRLDFVSGADQHEADLDQTNFVYPELIDDYYANLINGASYELARETWEENINDDPEIVVSSYFEKIYAKYPERRFGYWKSAYSKKINQDFYCSTDGWIIPNSCDFNSIVREYSGIENLNFLKADFFAVGNISYIISKGLIVHFPFGPFIQAMRCAHSISKDEFDGWQQESWMHRFLTFDRGISRFIDSKENYKGYPEDRTEELILSKSKDVILPGSIVCFYLSEYGDNVLVKDSNYSYLFFGVDKLANKELISLGNRLSSIFQTTANLAGIHVEIKCQWDQLDDESFEELCYDIIYYNPKFDNSTIRKMGKSRSRDGGRDIVVYTHSRPGVKSKKYIFQCKYLKRGTSLTASKVVDISDTISQYDAAGYGIMSNAVIDATLFDKLDRLSENLKVEIEDYSVYKLERILACYPQVKQRHFKIYESGS